MTDLTYWSVLVTVGLACGFLNTLASSGSAVSLPILVMLGLPEMVANATNRLPVLLGALTASWSFTRRGQMHWPAAAKLVPPALVGSIGGALLAERLGNRQMGIVITGAVLVALVLIFTKVKKALSKQQNLEPEVTRGAMALILFVGFWLGFIVVDGAAYLLWVLILTCHYALPQANALKAVLLAVSTAVAIAMFAQGGQILWTEGAIMSIGSLIGASLGARLSNHPHARARTFKLLVVVILLELAHLGWHYTAPLRAMT